MKPSFPPVDIKTRDRTTRVTLTRSNLDDATAPEIGTALSPLADAPDVAELVLDFQHVQYLSSAGLGKLVGLHLRMAKAGRRLVLENLQPLPYEVVRAARLDRLLDIHQPARITGRGRLSWPPESA